MKVKVVRTGEFTWLLSVRDRLLEEKDRSNAMGDTSAVLVWAALVALAEWALETGRV
jgi:hypothetical protein